MLPATGWASDPPDFDDLIAAAKATTQAQHVLLVDDVGQTITFGTGL